MSAYQLGPWCGIVQTVEQNYFHCPSHRHPSGCWHHCTAVGFQYCHNLLLLLSSSWVFLTYSHHQILLKNLCKRKTYNNNLDNIQESSKIQAQDLWFQKSMTFAQSLSTSSRAGEIPTSPSESNWTHQVFLSNEVLHKSKISSQQLCCIHVRRIVTLNSAHSGTCMKQCSKTLSQLLFSKAACWLYNLWTSTKAYGDVDNSAKKNLKCKDDLNTFTKWCKLWWKKCKCLKSHVSVWPAEAF